MTAHCRRRIRDAEPPEALDRELRGAPAVGHPVQQ